MQVNSNKISDLLGQSSATALANVQHVRLTSTPGDDLAEEDFATRVHSFLQPMTGLVSLTICIPSMARLHPSNSLPKVLDVLRDASNLLPQCRMGLIVHEAEQAWTALPILNRIVELQLSLDTIEFSRAYFPVEAMIRAAHTCGLASLSIHATQVSSSSSSSATVTETESLSMSTLASLTADAHCDDLTGLHILLDTAANTLVHLDLSLSGSGSNVKLGHRKLPRLERLTLHEDLLHEVLDAHMPTLHNLIFPTVTQVSSCEAIDRMFRSSSFPQLREVRVSRVVAGEASKALAHFEEKNHDSITVTIGELAVRDPASLTPRALALAEHLVNVGPPIDGEWPLRFGERKYLLLKSVVLKVHDGHNHDEFILSLDAPNLDSPPSISLIGRKKNKANRR